MPKPETNRLKITRRLESEGWVSDGGKEHEVFRHTDHRFVLSIPRHRELSIGVARSIGKAAGW